MSDVLVLTPGESIRGEYATSLVKTINYLHQDKISVQFGNIMSSIISEARNVLWQESKNLFFSKVFWIDSDISWTPEDFYNLFVSDYDIISGVYLDELGRVVAANTDNSRFTISDLDNKALPTEATWVGFGFVCISREVVSKLNTPFVSKDFTGEDVSFCYNARNMGFKVFLDPATRVTHHKTMAITP